MAALAALTLSGCTAFDDRDSAHMAEAVEDDVANVTGAYAHMAFSGTRRTIWIRVYIDDSDVDVDDAEQIAEIVDDTLESVWHSSPVNPASVTIDVIAGTEPDDVQLRHSQGLDLKPAAAILGLEKGAGDSVIKVTERAMLDRYGERGGS